MRCGMAERCTAAVSLETSCAMLGCCHGIANHAGHQQAAKNSFCLDAALRDTIKALQWLLADIAGLA